MTDVVVSVPDGMADVWANQYVSRQPQARRNNIIGSNPSIDQVLATYTKAAADAGSGGRVIINVGHGASGGLPSEGMLWLAPNARFVLGGQGVVGPGTIHVNVFYDTKHTPFDIETDLEHDQNSPTPEGNLRLKRWAVYQGIGAALQKNNVRRVMVLTCRVGGAVDFIKKIANDWGLLVTAFKDQVVLEMRPNGRMRLHLKSDPEGQGSNIPEGEEELPVPNESNSYTAGPPL